MWTHPGLGQLFDLLHLLVRHDAVISDDAGAVPLVFLLHRTDHVFWVPIVVVVTAEEAALPARSLMEKTSRVTLLISDRCAYLNVSLSSPS